MGHGMQFMVVWIVQYEYVKHDEHYLDVIEW